jgi:hypothetical protein
MVFMVCATAERLRKEGNQENFCPFWFLLALESAPDHLM